VQKFGVFKVEYAEICYLTVNDFLGSVKERRTLLRRFCYILCIPVHRIVTIGQSNLAKAASNAKNASYNG